MRTLGLHLLKNDFRYTALDGSIKSPTLVEKGKIQTIGLSDIPALMDWYDSQFEQLMHRLKPDKLAYRLSLEPTKEQIMSLEFPLGVLNLIAHRRSIPIREYSPQSFVPSRLGLPKNSDMYSHCSAVLGEHPPHWDTAQKHSTLVAWFEL